MRSTSIRLALVAVLALLATVLQTAPAAAQQGSYAFFPEFQPPANDGWAPTLDDGGSIPYYVHRSFSAWVGPINRAAATWENDAGSDIRFEYMGLTDTHAEGGNPTDGINVIGPDLNSLSDNGGAGLATFTEITRTDAVNGQAVVTITQQFDIKLNPNVNTGLGTSNNVTDVESVVLHELGHVLGLDHVNDTNEVMHPTIPVGDPQRSLGPGERTAMRLLYPSSAPAAPTCVGVTATIYNVTGTVQGTENRDVIVTGPGVQTIFAKGGNDLICAGGGNDIIHGGPGDDIIYGQYGADTMFGGDGNDQLLGGPGYDNLNGQGGNDIVNGAGGNDTLRGGPGADSIYGKPGNDTMYGDAGNDEIYGASGRDTAWGGSGNDRIQGAGGNDELHGGPGADTLYGQNNDDDLYGDDGDDTLYAAAGNDYLEGGNQNDNLQGGGGNDTLVGGPGNDVLYGQSGNDTLNAGSGSDRCFGGEIGNSGC